jgi:hypothetical protein
VYRRARDRLPELLLAAAVAASGALLLVLTSRLTFLLDDWDFLIHRRGFDAHVVLDPHNEHISVLPVLIYKGIQATIGMESLLPYAVVSTGLFLLAVVLLFVILRRAVGAWLALAGVLPLLVFGSASEDLLTPFQLGYFGSVAAGLGALLALERRDGRTDAGACGLLVVSLCFSSVGLPFVAGAAVWILLGPDRWRRLYVVALPAALYLIWWLGWGHTAKTAVTFSNFATSPSYVLDGFASSLSSLLGLASPRDEMPTLTSLDWGRPLLVAAIALAVFALRRVGRISDRLLVALAIGLSFWFLASLNSSSVRAPTVSRYQFVGAVMILLIAAELARGARLPTRGVAIALGIAAASALSNASFLHNQYTAQRGASVVVRGNLAGLEIAADRVSPDFRLTPQNSGFQYFGQVDAGSFLSAADKFGSPGYGLDELPGAPDAAKAAADRVAAAADGVRLRPAPGQARGCRGVPLPSTGIQVATLGPSRSLIRNLGKAPVHAFLARYSALVSVDLGEIAPGSGVALAIPPDRSDVPWRLALMGPGRVSLCGAAARS